MKKLITIFLICLAQYSIGQVIPQRITVLNSGGGSGTNKVDSATTSNDSLYYWINGSKHFGGLIGSGGSVTISPGTGVTITGTGTSIDPYVINATGGSGGNGGRYVIPDYGIIVDSSVANQYKISVDSATLKDIHYLKKPIYADGDTTKFNSDYERDTLLNLAGGTTGQSLIKNSSTNGDWSWGAVGGGKLQSVTGLNTNNSDPLNPVVQISVDGTSVTGDGTPAHPLAAGQPIITKNPLYTISHISPDLYDTLAIHYSDTSHNGALDSSSYRRFYNETDTSFRTIIANNLGLSPNYSLINPKGLFLINNTYSTTNAGTQSSPSIFFKNWGSQVTTNYPQWFAINTSTDRSSGINNSYFNFLYSTDSINWNSIGHIGSLGLNFAGATLGQVYGLSRLVSATANNGFLYSSSFGWYIGNNNVNNSGLSLMTFADTGKVIIPPRGSTNARRLITNTVTHLSIGNGGTGYVSGVPAFTGGNGVGLTANVTATGGVITSFVLGSGGKFYTYGDTIRLSNLSGTGAYFIVDGIQGDIINGGIYTDTTRSQFYQWNNKIHGWNSLLDSANTYVAGNQFLSQTSSITITSYVVPQSSRYDISGAVDISAVSGGTLILQATWTDINGQPHTKSFYSQGTTTAALSTLNDASTFPSMRVWAKAGTTITLSTVVTGTITYDATGTIIYLR